MASDEELAAIAEAAADLEDDAIDFLREMIRTPSVNPPGEYEEIHALVEGRFLDLGWDCETVRTPDRELERLGLDPAYPRPNLLASVARGEGPEIALNAHFDTVPVDRPEAWSRPPFGAEVADGRVYGRGANDSKGRIAAYALAGRILEAADLVPADASVTLAITCDEETGGRAGPGYLVESGALRPDYAVVEGNCESIWIGVSGVLQFQVTVEGTAAHAGMNPEGGANAVLGAGRVLRAVEEYAESLAARGSDVPGIDHPTCVPATIEGGVKTNVVPPSCAFTVDHRVPPDFDPDELERAFRDAVERADLPRGVSVVVDVALSARPYRSAPDDPHVEAVRENAAAIFGREPPLVGVRGFSDGRFFAAAGAKTINFGPGDSDSNPHAVDENVSVDQVRDAAAVVAASVVDLARR